MRDEKNAHAWAEGTPGAWRAGNAGVACTVRLLERGLSWEVARPLGEDAAHPVIGPCAPAELLIDGASPAWRAARVHEAPGERGSCVLAVFLEDGARGARLTRYFESFPGHPFVRTWGTVENLGDASFRVTAALFMQMELPHTRWSKTLFTVEQFSWVYRPDFFSRNQAYLRPGAEPAEVRMGSFPSRYAGPTACAWAALREGTPGKYQDSLQEGPGLVLGIEFDGKSRLRAWADEEAVHLAGTIDDLNHRLEPRGVFEMPAFFVGLFQGDWDEAGYVTQRFAEAHVHPPLPDARFPWAQYNTWGYGQDIGEAQQLEAIRRCAVMGVEAVVLDLGWAAQIGEWRAHPTKFPRGLRPLSDRAHELGMKFGVHIPLAQANLNSPVAREHPDWLTQETDDYFGAAPLCLGHTPAREWLIGEIVRFVDEYGIDYIVHDGEDMVKRCSKTTHTHAPGDSNYSNSTLGLDLVVQTCRQLRPDVVWENCEDGGCMLTYKMARNYHSSITVDNIATYATRQGVYGASYPFSPRYSVRYMQDDPTPYTLRSAIFGGPLILMQKVTDWRAEQMAQTAAAIAEYKAIRELVRDAKIIHLLPPRHNADGIGWGWDAIQAVSADRARSVAMVYRAQGGVPSQAIRPRGLAADATYRVRLQDAGRELHLTGAELAEQGVEVTLGELSSEVLHMERA